MKAFTKVVISEHRPEGAFNMGLFLENDLHRRNSWWKLPKDKWNLECSMGKKYAHICGVVCSPICLRSLSLALQNTYCIYLSYVNSLSTQGSTFLWEYSEINMNQWLRDGNMWMKFIPHIKYFFKMSSVGSSWSDPKPQILRVWDRKPVLPLLSTLIILRLLCHTLIYESSCVPDWHLPINDLQKTKSLQRHILKNY